MQSFQRSWRISPLMSELFLNCANLSCNTCSFMIHTTSIVRFEAGIKGKLAKDLVRHVNKFLVVWRSKRSQMMRNLSDTLIVADQGSREINYSGRFELTLWESQKHRFADRTGSDQFGIARKPFTTGTTLRSQITEQENISRFLSQTYFEPPYISGVNSLVEAGCRT